MAIIKEDNGLISGGTLNPTAIHYDYISSRSNYDFTIDVTKTYVVAISVNISDVKFYMNTYVISHGTVSNLQISPNNGATLTMQDSTTARLANTSVGYSMSYQIIQLD